MAKLAGTSSQSERNSSKWLIWLVCREPLIVVPFPDPNSHVHSTEPKVGGEAVFVCAWVRGRTRYISSGDVHRHPIVVSVYISPSSIPCVYLKITERSGPSGW